MHNTGNELASNDILDFSDNCVNLDTLMNSDEDYWVDRFNNKKPTIDYALRMAGFTPAGFDFTTGGVLKNGDRNKCVFNLADQTWYSWSGDLPYNVIAGSVPGEGWKVVNRNALTIAREALRRTYQEAGYNLVEGSFEEGGRLVNVNDVLLQESTGKAFSGPAGAVAAGTNPSSGGFVDRSDRLNNVLVSSFLSQYPSSTTGAINAAIAYAQSIQRKLVFPKTTLTIDSPGSFGDGYAKGIHFPTHNPYDHTKRFLVDFNGVRFLAGADNQIVLKISGSYGKYEGFYSVESNGKVGVVGTAIAPEQINSTLLAVASWGGNPATSIWNEVCKSYTKNCKVGLLLAVGGNTTTGLNSACYYNTIHEPSHHQCEEGIQLYGGYAAGMTIVNRNKIIGGGAYDYQGVKTAKIGISINGGDTNRFIGYDFESIPKAVKVRNSAAYDSVYNEFLGCMAEGCTVDVELDDASNSFIGCGFNATKMFVGGALGLPRTFIAADPYQPQAFMGLQSLDSINMRLKAGATLGDIGKPNKIATNVQPAAADLANVTNVHAESRYAYRVFNGICTLHVKLLFTGVTLTAPIHIALPETPNNTLYTSSGNIRSSMFPVCVRTSGDFVVIGTFSDEADGLLNGKKFIKISPPSGNWSSGQFNKLNFEISYQIA